MYNVHKITCYDRSNAGCFLYNAAAAQRYLEIHVHLDQRITNYVYVRIRDYNKIDLIYNEVHVNLM